MPEMTGGSQLSILRPKQTFTALRMPLQAIVTIFLEAPIRPQSKFLLEYSHCMEPQFQVRIVLTASSLLLDCRPCPCQHTGICSSTYPSFKEHHADDSYKEHIPSKTPARTEPMVHTEAISSSNSALVATVSFDSLQ